MRLLEFIPLGCDNMTERSKHDAPGQLVGYLYQVLAALLLLFENKNPEAQICIERFDDVAFVVEDTPQIVIQTKHQISRHGSLNDNSVDLWRTINSWCSLIKTNKIAVGDTSFVIITTARAKDGSAASCLTKTNHRNCPKARRILNCTAETDTVQKNQNFYSAYLSLCEEDQEDLIKNIFVYDNASSIVNIKNDIMLYVRNATLPTFEERVYDKILGWWTQNAINCLVSKEPIFISYRQLQSKLHDVGGEYKADSLPIDVDHLYQPTDQELDALQPENRMFIEQLYLISISNGRLKRCIRDYYNAYRQRSQWVREKVLYIDELTKYEASLIDEWHRIFLIMEEDISDHGNQITEKEKRKKGRELFGTIEDLDLPIRKNVTQPFIMRGTYHELANQLKVGWHIDFYERLCKLLRG
jgi:hypothetical protein